MDQTHLAAKLQKVADYRTVRKTLKRSGMWSILFGAVAVVWGLWAPVDWILAALGLVLLGTGIWNIVAPRPTGIILDGITLLLVGLYNLIGTVFGITSGANVSTRWALVGVWQLVWGVQRIMSFKRFASAFAEQPSDAELHQIEETVGAIRKARAKESTDIIEFSVDGMHRQLWKARLAGDEVVFVEATGADVLIGTRQTVEITSRGKVMIGNALKADLAIGPARLKGTISPDSFRLYEQWKTGVFIPKAIAA